MEYSTYSVHSLAVEGDDGVSGVAHNHSFTGVKRSTLKLIWK